MSELQLIDGDGTIDVPKDVAVCPYCGAVVTASFTAWTEDDNGQWMAAEVGVDCASEPDIDSDEWWEWFHIHSDMPYVYQLPVDTKVLAWVNQHYRFNDCKP